MILPAFVAKFFQQVTYPDGVLTGCWLWNGTRLSAGYGSVCIRRDTDAAARSSLAHRFSYEFFFGPLPKGSVIAHRCDNPPCCNPHHLFCGTARDNIVDKMLKGRQARGDVMSVVTRGSRNGRSKLSEADVRSIKKSLNEGRVSMASLAREYGVTRPLIGHIAYGRLWGHVGPEAVVG